MPRKPTKPSTDAQSLTHQTIAADISEFRKRGGRIEVLGNTPLRSQSPTAFRSKPEERKPPTPVRRRAAR
jgi:hypothetical protein